MKTKQDQHDDPMSWLERIQLQRDNIEHYQAEAAWALLETEIYEELHEYEKWEQAWKRVVHFTKQQQKAEIMLNQLMRKW